MLTSRVTPGLVASRVVPCILEGAEAVLVPLGSRVFKLALICVSGVVNGWNNGLDDGDGYLLTTKFAVALLIEPAYRHVEAGWRTVESGGCPRALAMHEINTQAVD